MARTSGKVVVVPGPDAREMVPQGDDERGGEHGVAVLLTFAVTHQGLASFEVHVLDPQLKTFEQAHASTVMVLAGAAGNGLNKLDINRLIEAYKEEAPPPAPPAE